MEKIETEIIVKPFVLYYQINNKSQSYDQWKFIIDGKYKYTERKRS